MAYFTKDFIKFFKEIENNNNREWFHENKSRFEKNVKEPFYDMVSEILTRINIDDPNIVLEPEEAIFRIYRDVRFSKDKSPYKNYISAVISRGGRKALNMPGFYFELNHKGIGIYGGIYTTDKEGLSSLRHLIANNQSEFSKLLKEKKFSGKFGPILGNKSKRLPKELLAAAEKQPLIYNTEFYYHAKLPQKLILDDSLTDVMMEYYLAGKKINRFFLRALI